MITFPPTSAVKWSYKSKLAFLLSPLIMLLPALTVTVIYNKLRRWWWKITVITGWLIEKLQLSFPPQFDHRAGLRWSRTRLDNNASWARWEIAALSHTPELNWIQCKCADPTDYRLAPFFALRLVHFLAGWNLLPVSNARAFIISPLQF